MSLERVEKIAKRRALRGLYPLPVPAVVGKEPAALQFRRALSA